MDERIEQSVQSVGKLCGEQAMASTSIEIVFIKLRGENEINMSSNAVAASLTIEEIEAWFMKSDSAVKEVRKANNDKFAEAEKASRRYVYEIKWKSHSETWNANSI